MWVLRFGNGVTSAGFTATEPLSQALNLREKAAAWERFLARFPSIRTQFADAKPLIPLVHAPRLPYVTRNGAGECWALLPSAQAFIDPLFSTGMPLTLLGIERLGRILERDEKGERLAASLQSYAQESLADAEWTAGFVGACYRAFHSFPHFAALSMFYFASASYGEMARRLERQESAGGFLGRGVPLFGVKLVECAKSLAQETLPKEEDFANGVGEAIASRNVAGLSDPAKRNWYGADLEDVARNAKKLGMESGALREVLRTAPWAQIPP
jgi:FADH2 O2-dependent halogenase